jgi:hypothetical protein
MRYIIALILLSAVFLWLAPSAVPYVQQARESLRAFSAAHVPDEQSFRGHANSLRTRIREKAMELLRKELHETVDDVIR